MIEVSDIWTRSLFPNLLDYVIMGFYLITLLMLSFFIQRKKQIHNPAYRYLTLGLTAKIAGAIALGLVYTLHYGRQDTLGFYISSEALVNLLFENPHAYFKLLLGDKSPEFMGAFTPSTGYPGYRGDVSSFLVVRITSIFTLLGFQNYFTTSILFASFFFIGFWKLYLLFVDQYPRYASFFAVGVFFFPSVAFWGSGILKDTITLSMTGWFLYATYQLFIKRRNWFRHSITAIITAYIIVIIKPYVLVALIPGIFIWAGWSYIRRIENGAVRLIMLPVATGFFLLVGFSIIGLLGEFLGVYGSLEGIIEKTMITYYDHTRAELYGENFYNLGEFDGTLANFILKAPAAINAGLFRPYLWESRNIFMVFAALENLFLLVVLLVVLWRTGPVKAIKIAFDEPLVIFCISFALVFAFAVGISTANFGALMRLKIPLLPFLTAGLFVMYKLSGEETNQSQFQA